VLGFVHGEALGEGVHGSNRYMLPMFDMPLPAIFTVRLVGRRWWIVAPSDHPHERAPHCVGWPLSARMLIGPTVYLGRQ
jgi:hypothetical protein